jgi:hypothetical protein
MAASELGVIGVFLTFAILMSRLPSRCWTLPHKDYWHAPERRTETVRYVRTQMLWAAVILQAAMISLWQSTINANLKPELRLPADFWWTLVISTVVFAVWVIRFVRHFHAFTDREKATER